MRTARPDEFADSQTFVRQVVERWRGAAGAKLFAKDDHVAEAAAEPRPAVTAPLAASPVAAPGRVGASPVSSRIDQIRAQLLRR